jgi:hypothetical protein
VAVTPARLVHSLVHEAHDHRPFAHCGGAALDRARAHVADGEAARDARVRDPLLRDVVAGDDEAVLVARDRVVEPVGARRRAEEREGEIDRQAGPVLERNAVEVPVLAVQLGDFAAVADLDPEPVEVGDEVARHRLAQVGAPVQQRDQRAAARRPDRGLPGRVAAADDRHARASAGARLRRAGG